MRSSRLLVSAILITGVLLVVGALVIVFTQEATDEGGIRPGRELLSNASESEDECVVCHANHTPGIISQFGDSAHFQNDVSCADCHRVDEDYAGAVQHPDQDFWVLPLSSPGRCSQCHSQEVNQFNLSRHSLPAYIAYNGTDGLSEDHIAMYEAIPEGGFLEGGQARNAIHALEGPEITAFACETCHNVGKPNPDGSVGDCTACHLRHEFSLEQVRKPETCNACHIGPDHPQWEIYHESPHGIAYTTGGDDWNWDAKPGTLTTADFPAPTCATCHFSGFGASGTTHDVGDRLTWYLFSPISERRPGYTENRNEMQQVCQACHSTDFIDNFYEGGDKVVDSVNTWVELSRAMVKPLEENGLLTAAPFDEPIDYTFFNIWHHWGRTAKFGAFMQGPDYTQWHGAYEIMHDLSELREQVDAKLEAAGLEPLELPDNFPGIDSARTYLEQGQSTPDEVEEDAADADESADEDDAEDTDEDAVDATPESTDTSDADSTGQ